MELYQIKRRVDIALDQLRVNDNYLLKNDVHEQSITHRLAVYLEHTFGKTHDIDCEYNKNIGDSSNQKRIYENIRCAIDDEDAVFDERNIIPDIVVHKRGRNDENLLVVEVKKSSNLESNKFDYSKLECYTANDEYNNLNYKYGVFIKVFTKQDKYIQPEVVYFVNGEIINLSDG